MTQAPGRITVGIATEPRALSELRPHPRNYRRHPEHQLAILRESLRVHGQQKPVVITPDGTILAGHGLVEAAKLEGWTEIACHVYDGPYPEAFLAMDNRASDLAEDDSAALATLLSDLREKEQLSAAGYDDKALDTLLADLKRLEPVREEGPIPEVQEGPTRVQPGEVWALGKHRVMCGDSASDLPLLLQGRAVDLVLTDPPYGVGVDYAEYEDTAENARELIAKVMPLLLKYPVVLLTPGVPCMWDYPRPDWVLAWVHPASMSRCRWGFTTINPVLAYGDDPYLKIGMGSRPTALVLATDRQGEDGHPTPKPLEMWEWFLERGSPKKGQTVLDPFLGSGTTLIAAERTGRICYGMELAPKYCDVILARWEAYTGQQAVKVDA